MTAQLSMDAELEEGLRLSESGLVRFEPRSDQPEIFDQQTAFSDSRDHVAFLMGGNASGKTESSAAKIGRFLVQEQPPPRKDTPFWIISNTYEQCCGVCWGEKLNGHQHIPDGEVEWDRIHWLYRNLNWPLKVPLLPWPGRPGKNWLLEFKSYEQGRANLQARSIGGFWFSEQFPWVLFTEVLRGCRDYMFPGGQICEMTPIDPDLCIELEGVLDRAPPGWGFYRLNTACNRPNLADAWYENFVAAVPDEMQATRLTGALATFEGVIYQTFNPAIHVFDGPISFPKGSQLFRGIDWGASAEHPFYCCWGYRNPQGDWTVYREHWDNRQDRTVGDHIEAVKEKSGSEQYAATYADPSRPDLLNTWTAAGVTCWPGSNAVHPGIDCVRSFLKVQENTRKPRLRVHASCLKWIEAHRKYRWMRGVTKGVNPRSGKPEPLKKDDDPCDANRYMIYTVERSHGAVPGSATYKPVDRRKSVKLERTPR